jgi:hypothetical protein
MSLARLVLVFLLFGFAVFMWALWWKLFKKGIQRQKDTLAILDKKLELSIREKGLQGTIKSKKFLLFVATAVVFIVLAHLIQRVIGG